MWTGNWIWTFSSIDTFHWRMTSSALYFRWYARSKNVNETFTLKQNGVHLCKYVCACIAFKAATDLVKAFSDPGQTWREWSGISHMSKMSSDGKPFDPLASTYPILYAVQILTCHTYLKLLVATDWWHKDKDFYWGIFQLKWTLVIFSCRTVSSYCNRAFS